MKRRSWLIWASVGAGTATVAALTWMLGDPPIPSRIRIATGDRDGAYFAFGNQLAELLERRGVRAEVLATTGSVSNVEMLLSRRADIAFAHSGVVSKDADPSLRAIAKIYSEPIWIFYRKELGITELSDLAPGPDGRKRRISIGADGSGTQAIARILLDVSGITEANADFIVVDQTAAAESMRAGDVDAMIKTGAPTAPSVQALLSMEGVYLLDCKNHKAYSRRIPSLEGVLIEPGVLSLSTSTPSAPTWVLASSALLVAREDTHPRVVELALKAANSIFSGGNLLDAPGDFPSARALEIPQHEAAERFMRQGESWWSRNLSFTSLWVLSRAQVLLVPVFAVLPLMRIVPLFAGMGVRREMRKRYQALQSVENALRAAKSEAEVEAALTRGRELKREAEELALTIAPRSAHLVYDFRSHAELVLRGAERPAAPPRAADPEERGEEQKAP